ncbi:MerR family transcriptional regulator [Thalassotalea ganghwensis]
MKIGQVSKQTNLGIHTIRYYEKQGLIKRPDIDDSGHRNYSIQDVDLLNWIACMKNAGMPLSQIQHYAQAYYQDDQEKCMAFLQQHLAQLEQKKQDIEHYLKVTNEKIARLKKSLT